MIEREEGKIGHSCSLSFSNAPLHFKHSSQPKPNPTVPIHTHNCLLSSKPHVSCVYFRDARGGKGKKKLHSAGHMLVKGGGMDEGGGR